MARQAGPLYFTGTIDDLTFYKMEGAYFARKKSSLTRKQFRTDPRFARSRQSAARFGEASKLASEIYRMLPKEAKGKGVIGKLTGQVGHLLREGKSREEVIKQLLNEWMPLERADEFNGNKQYKQAASLDDTTQKKQEVKMAKLNEVLVLCKRPTREKLPRLFRHTLAYRKACNWKQAMVQTALLE